MYVLFQECQSLPSNLQTTVGKRLLGLCGLREVTHDEPSCAGRLLPSVKLSYVTRLLRAGGVPFGRWRACYECPALDQRTTWQECRGKDAGIGRGLGHVTACHLELQWKCRLESVR